MKDVEIKVNEENDYKTQLKNMEDRYFHYINNAPYGVFVADENGYYTEVNMAASTITGYSKDELIGMNLMDLLLPEEHKRAALGFEKAKVEGFVDIELKFKTKTGEKRHWNVRAVRMLDKSIIGFTVDITDAKIIEEKQKTAEERNGSIIKLLQYKIGSVQEYLDNTLNEVIKITDSKIGYIYLYNDEDRKFVLNSWSKDVMKECRIVEKSTEYQLEKTGLWGEAVRQGKPIMVNDFQAQNPMKKGYPEGHVSLSRFLTIPVYYDKRIVAVVGVANKEDNYTADDIFHLTIVMENSWEVVNRLRAEEELVKAKKRAEAASVAKTQFLANMSHEIRTPMNGILGFLNLLEKTALDEEQLEYMEYIKSSTGNLLSVINDILDISRIEAERVELSKEEFNVRSFIEDCVSFYVPKAKEKGLEINLLIHSKVSEVIEGDPMRLRQVISNLISNAIKYTTEGQVFVNVSAGKQMNDYTELIVTVEDTGIGISEEDISKLFQPFSQVDASNTRRFGGTGLGLYICKKIITMMGGNITIESKPDYGTKVEFIVVLKTVKDFVFDEPANLSLLKGQCVLVVDDNAMNRKIVRVYLEEAGCMVYESESGVNALSILTANVHASKLFKCILVDHHMPGMNGTDFAAAIKAIPSTKDIPVILLTSVVRSKSAAKTEGSGVFGYLSKPFHHKELLGYVASAIEQKGSDNEVKKLVTRHTIRETVYMKKPKILLVEDDTINRLYFIKLLQANDLNCDIAINGQEAVEACEKKDYDIIFMDIHMPVMSGFEATKEIRKIYSDTNKAMIIAMTAFAMSGDREKCILAGMDEYVSKPTEPKIVMNLVERAKKKL